MTSLITTSAALPGFLVGSLGVQIRDDLQLSASALGFAIATFFFAAACCSFIGGSAAERRGPHRVLPYSLALSTVGYIGIALLASGLRSISLCTCIAGAANGLIQPGVNTLISRVVPTDQLGLAFAVKQSAIPATTLLGGVSVPLLGETVGWRFAFGLFAILPVSASVLLLRGFTAQAASNHLPERGRRPAQLPRSLGLLALGIALGAAASGALGAFFVSSAVEFGIGRSAAGWLAATGAAACIGVRLVLGRWSDVTTRDPLLATAAMMLIGAGAFAVISTSTEWAIVAMTVVGFGSGWGWPGLFNLAVVRRHPDSPGVATGITQTGTYVGAMTGPLLFGWVADHGSFAEAWLLAAGFGVLGAAAIVAGARRAAG